jgi:phosphatidylinositol alpha 1,6-mannosyltransferase
MRIAVVTESFLPRTDGVVRTVLQLLQYLRAHDHDARVFAPGRGPTEHAGFPVKRVPGVQFPLYPDLTIAPFSRAMLAEFRTWKPDIVHLASPFVLGIEGCLAGRAYHVPVAAHFQTDIARYARHFHAGFLAGAAWLQLRLLHNACSVNYAPTRSVRQDLVQHGIRNVRVLGRGVDTELFSPERRDLALRQSLLRDGENCLFLYVGRISTEKNLEALIPLMAGIPGMRLVLVGQGPYRSALEARFQGLPATFVGLKHGVELARLYAAADIFVFPSLTETFGQVVQEAMASGLPSLAFRSGGVQDLFTHGHEGYLCTPGDAAEWLATARGLAADPALRTRLGQQAHAATSGRTWDVIFTSLLHDYALLAAV